MKKLLWTWDSWVCHPDDASSYVTEYCELISFLERTGYDGVIIWGFIDARHGGIDAAREIAEFGAARGIRVLPGVGAGGYHGFSITSGLPFNLNDFLAENPDLRAHPRDGSPPTDQLMCLRNEQSRQWLADGARWLAETFEIGGVNIETNEMGGICACDGCSAATSAEPNRLKYAASYSDLAEAVPLIADEVRRARPGAWTTYATYEPPWWQRAEDSGILAGLPEDAVAQWNMEMSCDTKTSAPVERNFSLVHQGGWSYHLAAFPPRWGFTQFRCFNPDVRMAHTFVANQRAMGVEGIVLGNAGSHQMPDNEINYLAYSAFADDPSLTPERFLHQVVPELYGHRATEDVCTLLLNQPEVHEKTSPIWKAVASRAYFGDTALPLVRAEAEHIEMLERQLALAARALGRAHEAGQARLQIAIDVLGEYLTVCRMARDSTLAALSPNELRSRCREAGLPPDINGLHESDQAR